MLEIAMQIAMGNYYEDDQFPRPSTCLKGINSKHNHIKLEASR